MNEIIEHIWQGIVQYSHEEIEPVFDTDRPICATGDMRTWSTRRPNNPTTKSHISHAVFDSTWETPVSLELERSDEVVAWAKNDHLGFEVQYVFKGSRRKYRPDFLARLANGHHLVIEVKGQPGPHSEAKHTAMRQWVTAVNQHAGFGRWHFEVCDNPKSIHAAIARGMVQPAGE